MASTKHRWINPWSVTYYGVIVVVSVAAAVWAGVSLYQSWAGEAFVTPGDSAAWVVALSGIPVIAVMVAGAGASAQMWLTSWHPGTCWDVLVVDLLELALAAQAP